MRATKQTILLDSDVVRHFIKGSQVLILPKIYPGQLAILDKVRDELCRSPQLVKPVNNFIDMCKIQVLRLESQPEAIIEYAKLVKSGKGEGESACLAYANVNPGLFIVGSSNLKDVKKYCEDHSIQYLTTMDILHKSLGMGILTETECNTFISEVKNKGSKLPTNTMEEYIKSLIRPYI